MIRLSQKARTRVAISSLATSMAAIPIDFFLIYKCGQMRDALRVTAAAHPAVSASQLSRYEGMGFVGLLLFPLLILLIVFLNERRTPSYRNGMKILGAVVLLGTIGQSVLSALVGLYLMHSHALPGHPVLRDWLILGLVLVGVSASGTLLLASVPYGLIYLALWLFPGLRKQQTGNVSVGMVTASPLSSSSQSA